MRERDGLERVKAERITYPNDLAQQMRKVLSTTPCQDGLWFDAPRMQFAYRDWAITYESVYYHAEAMATWCRQEKFDLRGFCDEHGIGYDVEDVSFVIESESGRVVEWQGREPFGIDSSTEVTYSVL